MCDLICDVISCCVLNCDTGKINVYDIIVIDNKQNRKYENQRNLYINPYLKDRLDIEFTAC